MDNINVDLIFNNVCKRLLKKYEIEPARTDFSEFVFNYDPDAVLRISGYLEGVLEIDDQIANDITNLLNLIYESDFINYIEDCAVMIYEIGKKEISDDDKRVYQCLLDAINVLKERDIYSTKDYDKFVLESKMDYYVQFQINKTGFEAVQMSMKSFGLNRLRNIKYSNSFREVKEYTSKVRK